MLRCTDRAAQRFSFPKGSQWHIYPPSARYFILRLWSPQLGDTWELVSLFAASALGARTPNMEENGENKGVRH